MIIIPSQSALSETLRLPSIAWQRYYVELMLNIIAHALVAISQSDSVIRKEISGYPIGLTIRLGVLPDDADNEMGFTLQVTENHALIKVPNNPADLTLRFKHMALAFLVLSFQESTAQAFANDRIVADGDLAYAIRFVRLLNQLQAVILPKAIAKRAIKRYPNLSPWQKTHQALGIYSKVANQLIKTVARKLV